MDVKNSSVPDRLKLALTLPHHLHKALEVQGYPRARSISALVWSVYAINTAAGFIINRAFMVPWILPQEHTGWVAAFFTTSALMVVVTGALLVGFTGSVLAGTAVVSMFPPGRPGARIAVPLAILFTLAQVALAAGFLSGIFGDGGVLLSLATIFIAQVVSVVFVSPRVLSALT